MESPGFGGVSVRPHAHTPKSGSPPRRFPKNHYWLSGSNHSKFSMAIPEEVDLSDE